MKFVLVDRVTELEPGRRIVAHKALSLAEEYLADHFPRFPVLPGVLMLESMVQTSAWLVRVTYDFAPSLIVLKEARNVTYKSFVAPGQVLTIEAECREMTAEASTFAARGRIDEREILKGQLSLRHLSLADRDASLIAVDDELRSRQRGLWKLIWNGQPRTAALAGG